MSKTHFQGASSAELKQRLKENPVNDDLYFPPGSILVHVGELVRENWSLCDGKDGRPDLREKGKDILADYYIYKWDEFNNQQREIQR